MLLPSSSGQSVVVESYIHCDGGELSSRYVGLESGKSMYSIDLVEADKEIDDYAK